MCYYLDINNNKKGVIVMNKRLKQIVTIAAVKLLAASLISCGGNGNDPKTPEKEKLTGTVKILAELMEVGKTATVDITNSNGTADKFTYQWTRKADGGIALEIEDATGKTYTITETDIGHTLGAIVSNADTKDTIFGEAAEKVIEPAKECKCEDKAHLGVGESCDCEADEGLCECTLKVYGTLANGVKVYRKGEFEAGKVEAKPQ